jgi:BirA family transcriptional regulator, biotin operon repressor / biotin---[acetyl-CoA-carboxylase] ligase
MTGRLPQGVTLVALDSVGSTNDEAKTLAVAGAADGTVVTSREQTRGRGRRGRDWASPPGNLYMSLLLRPQAPMARLPELGFLAAVALTDTLAPLLPEAARLDHKWPNDVLLGERKLAGILVETAGVASGVSHTWAVIGIGVNLARHPSDVDRPATSLSAAGSALAPDDLLAPLLDRLLARRDQWLAHGFAPLREAWLARAAGLGEAISLRGPRGAESGVFAGLDESGALLLGGARGVKRVPAAEIVAAAV